MSKELTEKEQFEKEREKRQKEREKVFKTTDWYKKLEDNRKEIDGELISDLLNNCFLNYKYEGENFDEVLKILEYLELSNISKQLKKIADRLKKLQKGEW